MEPRDERLLASLRTARSLLFSAERALEGRTTDTVRCPACGAQRHPLDLRTCPDCGREVCDGCRCICPDIRAVSADLLSDW